MWYVSVLVWLTSLSTMPSRFTQFVANSGIFLSVTAGHVPTSPSDALWLQRNLPHQRPGRLSCVPSPYEGKAMLPSCRGKAWSLCDREEDRRFQNYL